MGQKVHPIGMRLGYIKESSAKWFPESNKFAKTLEHDIKIRKIILKRLSSQAGISGILIARTRGIIKITIRTAKPGIVIGKKGEDIERIRKELAATYNCSVNINIEEIRKPEIEAILVAQAIAQQLERRIMFRRAMKRAVTNALRQGAKGIMVKVGGRLGGAEIARTEWYREGRVPLHTLRADIDYGTANAQTTYGVIGVKVWIFKGEILKAKEKIVTDTEVV